jgi:hypothetical protein
MRCGAKFCQPGSVPKLELRTTQRVRSSCVWRSLESDGYPWIHDFIGERQGQYDPKRLSIANQILAILPEKLRKNEINGRLVSEIKRPKPGRLCSPFEQIRSGEILLVFQRWFTIEWEIEFDAFLHRVAPPGTQAAYLGNEDTTAVFEVLVLLHWKKSCRLRISPHFLSGSDGIASHHDGVAPDICDFRG